MIVATAPPEVNGSANGVNQGRLISLLRKRFFNRIDKVAFRPPWEGKSACPAIGEDNLDAMLAAHLDAAAPEVTIRWRTQSGKEGTERGRCRIGTYSPAADGTTCFAVLDLDGDEHHKPLADPFGAALQIIDVLKSKGIVAHLEMSGSAKGWHVWIFFSEPVSAAKVRKLLFALIPAGILLVDGKKADPRRNVGIEVFPKQDVPPDVGNQVWLPWYHGAKAGGNQFYRVGSAGEIAPHLPDDFETVTPAALEAVLATIPVPPAKPHSTFQKRATGSGDDRPSAAFMIDWALRRETARNDTGSELARQLRDNGFSRTEAESIMKEYARSVSQDGHPYTEKEAIASLCSAYAKPARQPWARTEPIRFSAGKRKPANGRPAPNESHERAEEAAEEAVVTPSSFQAEYGRLGQSRQPVFMQNRAICSSGSSMESPPKKRGRQ